MILSAFSVGYILLTAIGGLLVDKWGVRLMWPIAAIAWSICVGCLGFAAGFWSLISLRFLLGVSEGPHFPAMTRSISRWLSPRERARALSLGLAAIPLSSAVGAPITSYLVADFGWRTMFFIICSAGILWAFVWYFFFTDDPKDSPHVNEEEQKIISTASILQSEQNNHVVDWNFLLRHPTLIANNIAYFAFGYMLFLTTSWLPGYFLSQHNLDLKSVGWYLTIPWLVGAIFLKLGGVISDYLYRKTGKSRIARSHLIWICQLLSGVFFILLGFANSLAPCIILLSLGLGFGFMPQAAFFSINIDVAKEKAGSAQGITSSCLSLAGISPFVTGWLIDLTGNYNAAFFLLAAMSAMAVLVVIFFHRPDEIWTRAKLRKQPDAV